MGEVTLALKDVLAGSVGGKLVETGSEVAWADTLIEPISWESQSDWTTYQPSTTGVAVSSGTVQVEGNGTDNFESYEVGDTSPGNWTFPNNQDQKKIRDADLLDNEWEPLLDGEQALGTNRFGSGFFADDDGRIAIGEFEPKQYESASISYVENTGNAGCWFELQSSSGDPLLVVGTNNPQVTIIDAGGGQDKVFSPDSPEYDVWRVFDISVDWSDRTASITWRDPQGNHSDKTYSADLMAAETDDISRWVIGAGGRYENFGDADMRFAVDAITPSPATTGAGMLRTDSRSFDRPMQPSLRNLDYDLPAGTSIDVTVRGSPTDSAEEQTVTLDGATSYDLAWSTSHETVEVDVSLDSNNATNGPEMRQLTLR